MINYRLETQGKCMRRWSDRSGQGSGVPEVDGNDHPPLANRHGCPLPPPCPLPRKAFQEGTRGPSTTVDAHGDGSGDHMVI